MTLRFDPPSLPLPLPSSASQAILPLARLQATAESAFLDAGRNLEETVDELHALRGQFDDLHRALGPERSAEFDQRIQAVNRQMVTLRSDLDAFGNASGTLRGALREIRSEVAALDRVMRTIAIVSINARIQGNSLVPARPQVSAFIRQLGLMSEQAEVILREVKHTMSGALDDIEAMGIRHQDMMQALHRDVLPDITRFSREAERMRDRQAGLHLAAQDLAAQMSDLFADVSRLVVALQIGDSTRQRLERAEDTVTRSLDADPALASALVDLGCRLIGAARDDARTEVEAAVATLGEVKARALLAIRSAGASAFGQTAQGRITERRVTEAPTGALEQHLAVAQGHFAALRARTEHVHDQLDSILRHEPALRSIANQIRLAGINAVITCAKLGHEGRTLRELAQWLRRLTDESDAIVLRLQDILASSQAIIRNVGEARIGGVDRSLLVFLQEAQPLGHMTQETTETLHTTTEGFSATTRRLPDRIDKARLGLSLFLGQITDLEEYLRDLAARQARLPAPVLPLPPEAEAELAALRGLYTMAEERRIHDQWDQSLREGAPADAPTKAACDAEDDDVFF